MKMKFSYLLICYIFDFFKYGTPFVLGACRLIYLIILIVVNLFNYRAFRYSSKSF